MYGTLARTPKAIDDYRRIIGDDAVDDIRRLAEPLQGRRVLHLSVTAFGTGVAELLNSAVPLFSDLGLESQWQVVRPAQESVPANKALYQALAGLGGDWSPEMEDVWLRYSAMNAELLTQHYDFVFVHDPQPAAIRSFVSEAGRKDTRWVFDSHLDLTSADPEAWAILSGHIDGYDAVVFDDESFVHPDLREVPVTIIRPAIDPLGPRNMELSGEALSTILQRYGIDPEQPLLCQIASCDPYSNCLGVIDVHERLRREVPGLQLALIASSPPEGADAIAYFNETVQKAREYPDAHILRGMSEVGNVEVNACQRAADVIMQTGLRRGFGIWISDAQWKERPVVSARVGGLPRQVLDGETGFLAATTDEFADRASRLLHDRELSRRLGSAARRHVTEHFLITRFLADELRLLTSLLEEGR